jgi:hypothetical protein
MEKPQRVLYVSGKDACLDFCEETSHPKLYQINLITYQVKFACNSFITVRHNWKYRMDIIK